MDLRLRVSYSGLVVLRPEASSRGSELSFSGLICQRNYPQLQADQNNLRTPSTDYADFNRVKGLIYHESTKLMKTRNKKIKNLVIKVLKVSFVLLSFRVFVIKISSSMIKFAESADK